MLKFLRTFALAAAMMLPFAMQAQQSWTVADGTTTHALVPLDFYNCDGSGNRQAQMLYPASLLTEMDGATIGTVKLYHQNTSSKTVTASTWYLRMGETSEADLSSGFSSETLTTVYSGNLVITGGVMTFELTTPYTYNGGNLIVEIQTSGASGNWFGSSSQGCYGVDNAGSTYSTMSSPNYTAFVPKATFTEVPSCFPVTGLAIDATQTTTSSLTLTWTDANNSGAGYDVYLVTPTDTTLLDNTTTTTYTATGLDANTAYVFGVVSNCGGDMAQMVTVSGRTACAAIATLPYTMGFEDADLQGTTSALLFPFCWTRINTLASGTYTYYPYAYNYGTPHDGGRHLYFYASSYGTYADTTGFVMPELDVTTYPMNGNRVTFWAKASSSSSPFTVQVGTMTDPTDRSTFTLAESVNVAATSYTKYTVSLASATATDAYVAFIVPKVTSSMYIDDVTLEELPSCGDITSVQIAGASTESITLSWTAVAGANGYTIYDMADNSVLGTTTDTTYTVDDLEPNTAYTLGVQSNCAGGDGLIATISGRTACSAIAIDSENTYTENFDSYTVSVSSSTAPSNYPNHEQPACWEFLNMSASSSAQPQAFMTGYSSYAVSGNCLFFKSSNSTPLYAILPDFEATTALQLQFSYRNEGVSAYNGTILVGVMSDASDATTFVALDSCAQTTTITHVEVNIPAAALEDGARVAFCYRGGTNNNYYAAIDNVVVREAPSCLPVSGLTVSNVAARTATLTWSGDADGYTIYDMRDTSAYEYANDTTVVLYALDPETAYTFGVTANCGSDESDMRTVSFTTAISCPAPTNLAAALTPGNGTVATLSWHEAGEAAEWQICIDGDMENLIDVTDTAYDMTGLTAEQAVTAKVRAICGADDTSAWSSTITFTPTDAFSVTVNDGTTTNNYVPIYGLYVDEGIHSQFIVPAADLSAMAYGIVNKLTFYASNANVNWDAASFKVYLTETDATTVNSLNPVADMEEVYSGSLGISGNQMVVTFNTPYQYMGGNLLVAFEQPTSGSYSSCSWYGVNATGASMGGSGTSVSQKNFLPKMTIDYIPGEEPSCLPVSGLAASDISTDEATLSWTGDAGSYNVYSISGADTTFVQNVSDTTVTLTGLDAMTQYTYGVRAVCGSDESDIRVVVFNTACDAVSLPYTETFAATSATRNCWNLVSNNTANVGGNDGMGFVTVSGRDVMRFSSYTSASDYNQYGFSPLMNVSTDATNLQVKVVYGTYGTSDQLFFGYITATDTVWDPTPYSTEGGYSASDWQSQTFVIPATATQLAVHYYGDYKYYAWVDSVVVTELTGDYCYPVSALTVDSATTTSISLSWTSDATSFTVLDMSDSSVIAANVATTSYEVTGLTAMTAYTFGVVVNCATGNSDTMTITATTACATTAINLPFNEDFSATSNTRNCWTLIDADNDGLGWTNQLDYTGDAQEYMMSYSYDNATYEALTPDNWMISPKLHSNANSTVTMQWKVASATSYPAEHYGIYVSTTTTDTSAFTMVSEWTISNGSEEVKTLDLSAYAGQDIYVAFRHHNCTDMYVLMIDDVQVYEGAYVPDTLKVTFATADATMGTTDPAPGVYNYIDGDTIFFGSQANNGYIFQKWVIVQGDGAPQEFGPQYANGYYVLASNWMSYDSVSFTAYFEPGVPDSVQVTYAVNNDTMGTITPAAGTYNVVVGSAVTAQATPNTGYELTAWVLGIYNATGSLINTDTLLATDADFSNPVNYGTIPQSFADNNYTITVTALFDVQSTPQPVTEATIAASAVTYWVGTGNNQVVMAINWADTALAWGVNFSTDSITSQAALDIIAANDPRFSWDTGSYGPGNITFTENGTTLTGDANHFWESKRNTISDRGLYQNLGNGDFQKWANSAAGVVVDSMEYSGVWYYMYNYPMTIYPVTAPQPGPQPADSIVVTFATNDATLGTTTPAPGTYTYHAGDTIRFSANATTGNSFVEWVIDYGDGTTDTLDAQYTAAAFLASTMMGYGITNMTLTAYFQAGVTAPDSIVVTYATNNAALGTTNPAPGTYTYMSGDTIYFNAIPTTGNSFAAWIINYSDGSADTVGSQYQSGYYFLASAMIGYGITSMTMTAYFQEGVPTPDSIEVTYAVNDATMGSITPNGTIMTAVGDTIRATANANAGYELYGWRFTVYVNGEVASDTTLAIVETSVNFGALPQFYANSNATITITAMFQQQVGIEDADISNVNVYSANSTIYVRGAEGQSVYVFDVNGRMLNHEAKASESCSFRMENTGVYLVKVGNAAAQRVIVVR